MNSFCCCQDKNYVQNNLYKVVKQNINVAESLVLLLPIAQKNMIYKILQSLNIESFCLQYIYSKQNQLEHLILITGELVKLSKQSKINSIFNYLIDDGIKLQQNNEVCIREVLAKLEDKITFQNILKILQKQDQSIRTIQNQHINYKNKQHKLILFLQYVFRKNLVNENLKQKIIAQNVLDCAFRKSQTQLNLISLNQSSEQIQ